MQWLIKNRRGILQRWKKYDWNYNTEDVADLIVKIPFQFMITLPIFNNLQEKIRRNANFAQHSFGCDISFLSISQAQRSMRSLQHLIILS